MAEKLEPGQGEIKHDENDLHESMADALLDAIPVVQDYMKEFVQWVRNDTSRVRVMEAKSVGMFMGTLRLHAKFLDRVMFNDHRRRKALSDSVREMEKVVEEIENVEREHSSQ